MLNLRTKQGAVEMSTKDQAGVVSKGGYTHTTHQKHVASADDEGKKERKRQRKQKQIVKNSHKPGAQQGGFTREGGCLSSVSLEVSQSWEKWNETFFALLADILLFFFSIFLCFIFFVVSFFW